MYFFGSELGDSFPPYLAGLEWISALDKKILLSLFTMANDEKSEDFIPRGQDISYNYDLVFSGCSETTGEYLTDTPETYSGEDIWGSLVSEHFKVPALSFGFGAASPYEINKRLLSRFSKHGNPKTLLCLYPDLTRLNIPSDPTNLIDKRFSTSSNPEVYTQSCSQISAKGVTPNYSKKPHLKEDVIPEIVPLWLNLQSILTLEQYCLSNNIKFLYSTWSAQTDDIISSINTLSLAERGAKSYPGYLDDKLLEWKILEENGGCLLPEHNLKTTTNKKYYKFGKDGKHMGTHRHMHFADLFIEKLDSKLNFQFTV
jgi:hypothetical protein